MNFTFVQYIKTESQISCDSLWGGRCFGAGFGPVWRDPFLKLLGSFSWARGPWGVVGLGSVGPGWVCVRVPCALLTEGLGLSGSLVLFS